jgi:hypothetical protein
VDKVDARGLRAIEDNRRLRLAERRSAAFKARRQLEIRIRLVEPNRHYRPRHINRAPSMRCVGARQHFALPPFPPHGKRQRTRTH